MKKFLIILSVALLGATTANAQFDLGSALGKLKDTATNAIESVTSKSESGESGNSITDGLSKLLDAIVPKVEIPGTWNYVGVAVEFVSDNMLTNAGGALAASTVEDKLAPMLTKLGIKPGAFSFTFNEDGTVTTLVGKKTVSGKWTYDDKTEVVTITLGPKEYKTRMTISGDNINILFEANKILDLVKSISSKSSNSTIMAIGAVANTYDGMNIGFECERAK